MFVAEKGSFVSNVGLARVLCYQPGIWGGGCSGCSGSSRVKTGLGRPGPRRTRGNVETRLGCED
jgi:hypothetical protein